MIFLNFEGDHATSSSQKNKKDEFGKPRRRRREEIPTISEKLVVQDIEDIPDRGMTFTKYNRSNFEKYPQKSSGIKDETKNITQYTKLVRAYVAEKKSVNT